MMRALADKLSKTGQIDEIDPEKATVRCLAHIIHLAVMAMLVKLGAITKADAESMPVTTRDPTAEELDELEAGLGGLAEEPPIDEDTADEELTGPMTLKQLIFKARQIFT